MLFKNRVKCESLPTQSLAPTSFSSFKRLSDQQLSPDHREEVGFWRLQQQGVVIPWLGRGDFLLWSRKGKENLLFIKQQTSKMPFEMYAESIHLKEVPFFFPLVQWIIKDLLCFWEPRAFSLTSRLYEAFFHSIFGIFWIINLL